MSVAWLENILLFFLTLYLPSIFILHILTWRNLRRKGPWFSPQNDLPPISIIKPVRGLDQEAEENFRSFIASDYPSAYEVIFCVEDRDDPAVSLIEKLIAQANAPGKVHLVFSERQEPNEMGKTLNLIAGVKASRHEFLVFSDSDTRNTHGFLAGMVSPLLDPKIGMTYACPVYRGARNWIAGMMALAVNETILALATASAAVAIGSAIAVRKNVLAAVGGLTPLGRKIGIDGALGRAVSSNGFHIKLIRQPVTIVHCTSTFRDWWQQTHRWLVTIRRYTTLRFRLIPIFSLVFLCASLYLILTSVRGNAVEGLTVWGFILAARLASLTLVNFFFAKEPNLWRYLWLAPLLDFLQIVLWLESYVNPYVVWRGRKYRVLGDATLERVAN